MEEYRDDRSKNFVIALLAVLVTSLAVLLGIQIGKTKAPGITQNPQTSLPDMTTTPIPTVAPTLNPTRNWETYTESYREIPINPVEFTFAFKYPNNWITEGRPNTRDTFWAIPGVEAPWVMSLSINEAQGKTVEQWIKRDQFPYEIIKRVDTGTIEGLMVSDPVTEASSQTVAFFKVEDKIFSIVISSDPPKLDTDPVELLEQILATFTLED